MEHVIEFMLLRYAIIAAVVVAVIIIGAAVLMWLRRAGRIDDARRMAGPIAQGLSKRDGMAGMVGRGMTHYFEEPERREHR
ncbi:hypothetical protein [Pseudonocardia sp. TRM90224]|uniref:hypothetical protein n=1 Tax=Pseudonocardia sp. TRM90224 TaxID=2812678 RepID=UPI001E4C70FC|nr:hypothetical protein [Pseudonocardia sp. TRM90224]